MKVKVNEDCISCGLCVNMCPEVFTYGDDGLSCVTGDPNAFPNAVQSAAESCPTNAIQIF
ncbi:MAG: ferredoxin [Clostridia bacterium]|nr:ferredoxin [Clostridia bacterium]